ncbi:MAG: DNA polymerase, partial [Candidatus Margulisbacteria bacterium]|nr:DNA polymerase [Candidatus Margulisiibacteriota bacterium]
PIIKRTKTGPSTDVEVLEDLAGQKFEIAEKLMEYRQLAKLKNTYVDVLPTLINPKTGRVHTSFNQTIAATGRLSSSNPNLQNIPLELRSAFIPEKDDWVIIAADYSQIELRILAHMSQDQQLIKAFAEGKDIHTATAAEVMGIPEDKVTKAMRSAAKAVNFGIIYGMSDFGLAKQLRIKKSEAAAYIEKYFTRHCGVKAFLEKTIREAKENGYVTTLMGRKRPIPDINSPNFSLRSFAERTATNTPIQGTAADLIKRAMINITRHLRLTTPACRQAGYDLRLLLQVHDELVFECPQTEATHLMKLIKEEMEAALELSVPVIVEVNSGKNWEEAK